MMFSKNAVLLFMTLAAVIVLDSSIVLVSARKPVMPTSARRFGGRSSGKKTFNRSPVTAKRKLDILDEEEDMEEEEEYDSYADEPLDDEEEDFVDDEEDEDDSYSSRSRRSPPSKRSGVPPTKRSKPISRPGRRPPSIDEEDPLPSRRASSSISRRGASRGDRRLPPRSSTSKRRGGGGAGRVVPYRRHQPPSAFVRGIQVLRNSIPDPSTVREAAVNSLNVAREATSGISATIYREVKGLTSSELEQVMLKATRPDDAVVKGKHAERLVGVTYQISSRYDIYDAVLRKLWAKMTEKDWRTTIKALYLLHRFSADGAPEHAPALKARLRELRRTRDPKRKEKYFNSKQLLAGDNKPETAKFRAFLSRYAHYVLLRAQCFGGMFDEISYPTTTSASLSTSGKESSGKKKGGGASSATPSVKPITSTALRVEHLEAAKLLLKAGVACQLKEGEDCENTAIAVERVGSDLISLTATVAMTLNRVLKESKLSYGADPVLIRQWCEFYRDELSPQTRAMVKKSAPKLDAYGQFLPSRMGTTVLPDLLEKGLKLDESMVETMEEEKAEDMAEDAVAAEGGDEKVEEVARVERASDVAAAADEGEVEEDEGEVDDGQEEGAEDEYEYDDDDDEEEEEYYDDEDAF